MARGAGSAAWRSMVSIGKLAPGQAQYYLSQADGRVSAAVAVASGAEDYYLGGSEPTGMWLGGQLVVGRRGDEVVRRVVGDWMRAGDPSGMIAHRRRDVAELNGRARALLRAAGRLGLAELPLQGGSFAAGDQVVVKLNDRDIGVRNGERGVVVAVDPHARRLDIRFPDRVVRVGRGFLETTTERGYPTIVHGYAVTAYVAQGMTCRRAFVLAREDASRQWAYTTMTRATHANRLYVIAEPDRGRDEFAPAEPPRDERDAVIAALSRNEEQALAIDIDGR